MFSMIPIPSRSDTLVIGVASVQFATLNNLQAGQFYMITVSTGAWVAQGANPTAVAGAAGSMFVSSAFPVIIDGANGAKVAMIQDTAGGKASMMPVRL